MDTSRTTRRGMLGAGIAAAGAALLRPRAAEAAIPGDHAWKAGNESSYVAGGAGADAGTLTIHAGTDLNVGAGHIRMEARDGNYELEHGPSVSETHLNSYYIGTPTRTPISIGDDDGQDLVSLVVRGKAGQKHDLQQWAPGRRTTMAVDGNGHLRLGKVVVLAEVVGGKARLVAVLPDGTRQVLARAR